MPQCRRMQDREAGVGGRVGGLGSRGEGRRDRGFLEGKLGKGITFEM